MTQPIKLDIDGTSGLWLLPFAKRQLARFKTLLPFGKRRFNLPAGEEVTIWWGQMTDRIRITARRFMPCRADGGNVSSGSAMWRRIVWMRGETIVKTQDSEHQLASGFIAPFFDFSKHGATGVEFKVATPTLALTRLGTTTLISDVDKYSLDPSRLSDMFSLTTNANGLCFPFHSLNQPGGVSPAMVSISADGETVIAISSVPTESIVIARWNSLTSVFDTTRVNLPPRVSELLSPLLASGVVLSGNAKTGTLFNAPLFAPYPAGFAATHPIGLRFFLHPFSPNRLYAVYQVGVHTSVGVTDLGGGVLQYHFTGEAQVGTTVYDVTSGVWEVLHEQAIPFGVFAIGGTTTGEDAVVYADRTYMVYHNDGGASIAHIQVEDVSVRSIDSFGIAHPDDTLPLLEMIAAVPTDDLRQFMSVGEGGLRASVPISSTSLLWRYGTGVSDTVNIPWAGSRPIMSRSGHWLVVPVGSFPVVGIKVHLDGLQVWDSVSLAGQYSRVGSDQPSYDRDGATVVLLTAIGTGARSRRFVSFVPDVHGVYQASFGEVVPPLLGVFPDEFIIPDECVGAT